MNKNILFILQYDSFINTFIPVMKYFDKKSITYEVILFNKWHKKNWINQDIKDSLKNINYKTIRTTRGIIKFLNKNFDICIFGTTGERFLLNFCHYIKDNNLKTKTVSGFIGSTLENDHIRFLRGVNYRSLCDMIFVPGQKSKDQIVNSLMLSNNIDKIKITGLPRFEKIPKINKFKATNTILFLEQPTYPSSRKDRYNLVQKLIVLANEFPNKNIIIKPRFGKLTGHAHRPKFLLQDIIKHFTIPSNLEIKYDNIYKLFQKSNLTLTISSTAGLEALMVGVPTYFINDYCLGKNKFGSQYYKDLNAVVSFNDIYNNNYPQIDYNIVNEYINIKKSSRKFMAEQILKLTNNE
tara:strand:+ start:700 stop:1755 length:1056 start_codon:yes stop_codon:yes gene_type:complete